MMPRDIHFNDDVSAQPHRPGRLAPIGFSAAIPAAGAAGRLATGLGQYARSCGGSSPRALPRRGPGLADARRGARPVPPCPRAASTGGRKLLRPIDGLSGAVRAARSCGRVLKHTLRGEPVSRRPGDAQPGQLAGAGTPEFPDGDRLRMRAGLFDVSRCSSVAKAGPRSDFHVAGDLRRPRSLAALPAIRPRATAKRGAEQGFRTEIGASQQAAASIWGNPSEMA